jgi:hypothetical protein
VDDADLAAAVELRRDALDEAAKLRPRRDLLIASLVRGKHVKWLDVPPLAHVSYSSIPKVLRRVKESEVALLTFDDAKAVAAAKAEVSQVGLTVAELYAVAADAQATRRAVAQAMYAERDADGRPVHRIVDIAARYGTTRSRMGQIGLKDSARKGTAQ